MSKENFLLPTKPQQPTVVNPRTMVIFSQKKTGKTHALSQLSNSLILDMEGGADFYECTKVNMTNLNEFDTIIQAFSEQKPQYDYIIIDTVTSLKEKVLNQLAVRSYNREENKNESFDFDVDKLAYGKGQVYKREALFKIMEFFTKFCKTLIVVGHVSDKSVTASGQTIKELNLEGKLKDLLALRVDAIGYMYRDPENKNSNILSFTHTDDVIGGSRSKHLRNKEFKISELNEKDELVTFWNQIFI